MSTILLGISGSISAYRAAEVAHQLTRLGHDVHPIMTASATAFITPLTLQSLTGNFVYQDVLEEPYPDKIHHIELAKQAEIFALVPASANTLAKFANGLADDLLSTVQLALPAIPKFIAPAMNTQMYLHPATQRNLTTLKEWGFQEIDPREGLLACGDYGKGALATVETIVQTIHQATLKE